MLLVAVNVAALVALRPLPMVVAGADAAATTNALLRMALPLPRLVLLGLLLRAKPAGFPSSLAARWRR
jgi:hypothetical protein